jgi:predicted ATP-binding protein involved in virulence
MPYSKKVALAHASSGIRRIVALAYILVWTWEEHKLAAKLLHEETAASIVLLIDEIEAHLHPHWQRQIVRAMLKVTKSLSREANLQLITTTHAPLVMASIEPFFEAEKDAWFDLDLEDEAVVLRQREFEKRGDANNWLTSDAFDLSSSRPVEYEELTKKASDLLENPETTPQKIKETYQMLIKALNPKDSFLFSWRYIAQKKGLLK